MPAPAPSPGRLPAPPLLPGAVGLLGHGRRMGEDPLALLSDARDLGPVVRLRFGPKQVVAVSGPAAIEQVLVSDAARYSKDTRSYRILRQLIGDGLVTSEGEAWLARRRIAQPAFLRKRVEALGERMVEAALEAAARWPAEALDVHEALNQLTLRIAGETLFSADLTGEAATIGEALGVGMTAANRLINSVLPGPQYWPRPLGFRFWRTAWILRRVTDALIARRRAAAEGQADLLGLLMAGADPESGLGLTDRQLRDEALTMLLAGHETTGNGLSWTLSLLSRHPEVVARLDAEHARVLGGRPPTAADAPALVYTEQVVKESLRLHPPVWVVERTAREDVTLGGHAVPRGTWLLLSQWAVHRDPKLWPDPTRFDPDRFAPEAPAPGRFAWFPFSRGQRQCIGDRFALLEMVLVLATLLPRLRFEALGAPPAPSPHITLRPAGGLPMRVTARAAVAL